MAPHGWRKSASVASWLADQGELFDFFQTIALLENEAPGAAGVGTGPSPAREVVKLRSSTEMSFPTSDVARVRELPSGKIEVTARLMGLAGALGPLPAPYAELVARRIVARDFALRDFLDIFNHRLLSLFYRARKRHRVGLGVRSPTDDDAARYFFALIGLGTPGLRDRLGVADRALLHYAGMLSRPVPTMAGLEIILQRHFGVRVQGKPLTGRLHSIEPDDRTALGPTGQRRALGRDAMIGQRVWIQDAAFELWLGPLSEQELPRFLPGGDALRPLCALVDIVFGDVTSYSLRLLAAPSAVKRARLGRQHGSRLSYTAWLRAGKSSAPPRPSREITLSFATLARFRAPPEGAAPNEISP